MLSCCIFFRGEDDSRDELLQMLNDRGLTRLKSGICVVLALCISVFVVRSMHWPLVNDASLMHYISFLIDQGWMPYRDLGEMNMPGCYLGDWLVMHAFGGGALAWRLYDLALMVVASCAILALARPWGWFAGVFGSCLFVLYHGRDGMGQLGQKDLLMAVLLLVSYAFLFHALRKNNIWAMGFFGLSAGMATMIKPTALPLAAAVLTLAGFTLYRRRLPVAIKFAVAVAGFVVPLAIAGVWLWHERALAGFWNSLRVVAPYYASLGRRSPGYVLKTCMSPSMQLLALAAAVIAGKRRDWQTWEGSALILGVVFGVAAYILQGKGFVYHRYPLAAFLMLWVGIEFSRALSCRSTVRAVGIAGLVFGGLVLPPLYLRTAIQSQWSLLPVDSLEADLTLLGGQQLSGHVQCIDAISGCTATLYRMRLVQSTGLLWDFFIFGPGERQVVRDTRANFWQAIHARPPRVIVVTSWLALENVGDYKKLAMWPDFAGYLGQNYDFEIERSFPPNMTGPQGYRIYVLKPKGSAAGVSSLAFPNRKCSQVERSASSTVFYISSSLNVSAARFDTASCGSVKP